VTGHEVTTSFDGKLAYVPIYGDSSVGDPGTDGRELVAIDVGSRKIVQRFYFGAKSDKIAAMSLSDWSIKDLIATGNRVDGLGWASLE
jgi:hypothetical protein